MSQREFVILVDTSANMLALRDALESDPDYSNVDGQVQANIFADPIPIVMVPLDQLDPRPSVRNMACLPQINPKEAPYTDAGLTREEMEALVARYRRQGRADEGVDGGSFLIGFGVATVLLWASVSWLWSLVFA
ncbi:uncharacterized protein BO95DRAFT_427857 [Aspergillus brunneoviolaceus CBS 621.78]|uniref:Uncharacterized protein n=1 Tax=Aspergillus brunneoviolaceus CBS 621.78 TaxID=1450534 RepID=A0ACD1GM95_9EURO|nr:hypothetical protein BO95DRAFT_427857 [Aspergillus brunneoviolaceus CBS 621.78]RAH50398.1 hypothetical protein BO95DRAFT_427857 [Aspergillus brunneoviolaceus CBS 621.78]